MTSLDFSQNRRHLFLILRKSILFLLQLVQINKSIQAEELVKIDTFPGINSFSTVLNSDGASLKLYPKFKFLFKRCVVSDLKRHTVLDPSYGLV